MLDAYYKEFNTDIDVQSKDRKEYQNIEHYVINLHESTPRSYAVKILEIFEINRHDEIENFSKYSNFDNRMLLWYGLT